MIDYCHRKGCQVYTVLRSIDSRPLKKSWYCSKVCKDLATRPMHWAPENSRAECGLLNGRDYPHLITTDRLKVTCEVCKKTSRWRRAGAEAA